MTLILELEAQEPISGWISPEGGERERFAGLLELLATLDRLRAPRERSAGADENR